MVAKRFANSGKQEINFVNAKQMANRLKSASPHSPHFLTWMTPSILKSGRLPVPKMFGKTHLRGIEKMLLKNIEEDTWTVQLKTYTNNGSLQTFIAKGWKSFCLDNCVTEEAYFVFELVTELIFKVRIYMCSSISSCMEGRSSSSSRGAKRRANLSGKQEINFVNAKQMANRLKSASPRSPHFIAWMTPSGLKNGRLPVPKMFGKTHLRGIKKMLLENVEGGIWTVQLKTHTNNGSLQTFITKGWKLFCRDNCVTEEAYFVFELTAELIFKVRIYMCSSMSSCMESRRCSEADLNSDYSPSKDSGFSENCDSHGSSSSSSRGVASLSSSESSSSSFEGSSSSSEGSCFIIEGNGHSSMASSSASVKSKCKKTREGSNVGGPATRTRRASCRQMVTFCDPGAVSAPDIGVQGVDIGSQTPEVVGDSVARDLLKEARVAAPRLAKNVESAKVKLAEAESALAANDLVLNHTDKAALTSRPVFQGLL